MNNLELAKAVEKFVYDPLGFVYFNYPWRDNTSSLKTHDGPDAWQSDTLNIIGEQTRTSNDAVQIAIASGHGIGKTALISWIIEWFISTRPHPQIVVTANTRDQLQSKTWRELAKWWQMSLNRHWFKWTATKFYYIGHPETWFANAIPWSKERSEAFAGTHEEHVLFLYDEASLIDDKIWEVTEGAMTTPGAIWIAFGNPTRNIGRFKECFGKGKFAHRWITRQIDSRTAKMADKKKIDQWIEDYGEDSDFVRVRVKGEFPRASTTQLIPEDLVNNALGRHINLDNFKYSPKILGVDVARFGDDTSAIIKRQGLASFELEKHPNLDNMELAARVAYIIDEWKPDAVFIDAGRGEGVIDRLRQLGHKVVHEINFGSKAMDERHYFNKRSEMWDGIKKWLINGGVLPDSDDFKRGLTAAEYGFDSKDRLQLEKKEDIKDKLPDGIDLDPCDALGLTFAAPVSPRTDTQDIYGNVYDKEKNASYDPLGRSKPIHSVGRRSTYDPLGRY